MIRDTLIEAISVLDVHKFGTKQKSAQEKAKQNAAKYMSIIKTLPEDYYKIMYMLWMAEREHVILKTTNKAEAKKFQESAKKIRAYIEDQISSVVYP